MGAGPSGLVLALWLKAFGVAVRIVDAASGPGTTSRALAVQARTLELYRQLDLAQAVVDAGHPIEFFNLWAEGKHRARIPLGAIGAGLTPYPFFFIYPQDRHEQLLVERLAAAGIPVGVNVAPIIPGLNDRDIPRILEAARECGAETHVVLPFPPADFRRTSVDFAGGDWGERFERALAAADSVTVTSDHAARGSTATFDYANLVLTGMGRLRAQLLDTQVRGIAKMIEDDKYCIDVLTQVSAATKALEAVALGLLDEHLRHCVT